jgi:hypothetical protein
MVQTTVPEDSCLDGVDNYARWERAVEAALGHEGLIDYIISEASVLTAKVHTQYPYSNPPTTAEQSKRAVALANLNKGWQAAYSVIDQSLGNTVQNALSQAVASFRDPKPKELFEEVQKKYGASSGN